MRRLPPLNALRTFEAAARHVSFVHAAEELSVPPGAVSRQVKLLEEWLGAPLFRRSHKQVTLTALGRTYLEAIGEPLEAIGLATERAFQREAVRPLSICCYPTFALRWLVPRWVRFYDAHPDIDVQITTSLAPVDFERDEFDAAIEVRSEPIRVPGMQGFKLVDVVLIPVCSPSLTRGPRGIRRPEDLNRATLLHNAPRPRDWHRWLAYADIDDVDPDAGVRFDSLNLSIQAAISGAGVAIAVRSLVEQELQSGELIQPFGPERRSSRPFQFTYPRARAGDRRLEAFAEWLSEEAAKPKR